MYSTCRGCGVDCLRVGRFLFIVLSRCLIVFELFLNRGFCFSLVGYVPRQVRVVIYVILLAPPLVVLCPSAVAGSFLQKGRCRSYASALFNGVPLTARQDARRQRGGKFLW